MHNAFVVPKASRTALIALTFCLSLSSCAEQKPMTESEIQEACRTELESFASISVCGLLPSTSYSNRDGMGDFTFCDQSRPEHILNNAGLFASNYGSRSKYCSYQLVSSLKNPNTLVQFISDDSMKEYCNGHWQKHISHYAKTCRAD